MNRWKAHIVIRRSAHLERDIRSLKPLGAALLGLAFFASTVQGQPTHVYWTEDANGNPGDYIYRSNLDGSGTPEDVVDPPPIVNPRDLALDRVNGKIYHAIAWAL